MQDYLRTRPHHKVPLIIVLICIIVVSLAYAISACWGLRGTETTGLSPSANALEQKKTAVIQRLAASQTQPLTNRERVDIVDFVSSGNAHYTDAEAEAITRMLRAQ